MIDGEQRSIFLRLAGKNLMKLSDTFEMPTSAQLRSFLFVGFLGKNLDSFYVFASFSIDAKNISLVNEHWCVDGKTSL